MLTINEPKTWELRLKKDGPAIRTQETLNKLPYPSEGQSLDDFITELSDTHPDIIDGLDKLAVRIPDGRGGFWKLNGIEGQMIAGLILGCRKLFGPVKSDVSALTADITRRQADIVTQLTAGKMTAEDFVKQNDALQRELLAVSKRDKEPGSWYLVDDDAD